MVAAIAVAILLSVSLYIEGRPSGTSLRTSSSDKTTLISIPPGSYVEPPGGFNTTTLVTGTYRFPFNFTVVLGSNSTVEWVNDDTVAHTVSSFFVPVGASSFNSDFIQPKGNFTVVLTVPGVYKYTCIWHPWLAGEITVKA